VNFTIPYKGQGDPHWKADPAASHPLAYAKGTKPQISGKLNAEGNGSTATEVQVKATGPDGIVFEWNDINIPAGGGPVSLTAKQGSKEFDAIGTEDLLKEGDGRCEAWVKFFLDVLERGVHERPECWLWSYKYWRYSIFDQHWQKNSSQRHRGTESHREFITLWFSVTL